MKIFGVTLVRSEADIIAVTICHHLQLGLDGVFVLDNASSDGTETILGRLAQADNRIRWSRHEGEYQQAELTTGLAQEAFRAGADWIVPFDADEFWYAPGRTFREVLACSNAGALRAQVLHYIQAREQSRRSPEGLLTITRRAARAIGPPDYGRALVEAHEIGYVEAMYSPKWIIRASLNLEIGAGNHNASNLTGKPETTTELVCLHAPVRSRDTLVMKAAHSRRLEAAGRPPDDGWHTHRVRQLAKEGSIDAEWAANSYKNDALDVYGAQRPVILDPTLRDAVAPFLVHAPTGPSDPEPSKTQAQRAAWQREMAQNFLTNLHDDALSRTEWAEGLNQQLARSRSLVADLEGQKADRTAWAKSLDKDLTSARKVIADLQIRVAERTNWGQSLDKELLETRAHNADLETRIAERTNWAQSLEKELLETRAHNADLETRTAERTNWAQSLDKELLETRARNADLETQIAERTNWAQSLDKELLETRARNADLETRIAERTNWGQSLEKELLETRARNADLETRIAERTNWAQSLDKELLETRAHNADLETRIAERTNWAQSLDKELLETRAHNADLETQIAERTNWAQAADRETEKARAAFAELKAKLRPV